MLLKQIQVKLENKSLSGLSNKRLYFLVNQALENYVANNKIQHTVKFTKIICDSKREICCKKNVKHQEKTRQDVCLSNSHAHLLPH